MVHKYVHTLPPKQMEDSDLTDIQIKVMFSMTATLRRTSGRDVMTRSAEKMMNDIGSQHRAPKPPNDCSLKDQ